MKYFTLPSQNLPRGTEGGLIIPRLEPGTSNVRNSGGRQITIFTKIELKLFRYPVVERHSICTARQANQDLFKEMCGICYMNNTTDPVQADF